MCFRGYAVIGSVAIEKSVWGAGPAAPGPVSLKRKFGSSGSSGARGCKAIRVGFACSQHGFYVCELNGVLPNTFADEFQYF